MARVFPFNRAAYLYTSPDALADITGKTVAYLARQGAADADLRAENFHSIIEGFVERKQFGLNIMDPTVTACPAGVTGVTVDGVDYANQSFRDPFLHQVDFIYTGAATSGVLQYFKGGEPAWIAGGARFREVAEAKYTARGFDFPPPEDAADFSPLPAGWEASTDALSSEIMAAFQRLDAISMPVVEVPDFGETTGKGFRAAGALIVHEYTDIRTGTVRRSESTTGSRPRFEYRFTGADPDLAYYEKDERFTQYTTSSPPRCEISPWFGATYYPQGASAVLYASGRLRIAETYGATAQTRYFQLRANASIVEDAGHWFIEWNLADTRALALEILAALNYSNPFTANYYSVSLELAPDYCVFPDQFRTGL